MHGAELVPPRRDWPGVFVTFEGVDGVGKTTTLGLVTRALTHAGVTVTQLREPGGTDLGDAIRGVLLNADIVISDPVTEMLLFQAARRELMSLVVEPALAHGEVVLMDRHTDSTLAYQGVMIPGEVIRAGNRIATGLTIPDLTILLDAPPEVTRSRRGGRGEDGDRIESRGEGYFQQVRENYLQVAAGDPHRVAVIDATLAPDEIAERVTGLITRIHTTRINAPHH